ncbi:MAG TPA: RidA family protein [Candidatus Binataceae bacterium]|nr:RidA family protein [Candidatus Binataceae bacterium]
MFGYARAVRAGDWLLISGTTAFDAQGVVVGRGQMYAQARQAIENIETVLERAGMALSNVVRTRIFLTEIGDFEAVARAHREAFGANPPAATVVEVRRLVHPDIMIEIEADAYARIDGGDGRKPGRARSAARTKPKAKRSRATS